MQVQEAKRWVTNSAMAAEYSADLGDARRGRRARQVGVSIAMKPNLSFPKLFSNEAELEGFYRLVENEDVEWRELLRAHAQQTVERVAQAGEVLIIHDTTDVRFRTYWPERIRSRMSAVSVAWHGLQVHTSLAATASGPLLPLGVLDAQPFVHKNDLPDYDKTTQAYWLDEGGLYDNEAERWYRAVDQTEQQIRGASARAIHVMDREGDSYALLGYMLAEQANFVVRCAHKKRLRIGETTVVGKEHVQLGEVRPKRNDCDRTNPPRKGRSALLTIRYGEGKMIRNDKSGVEKLSPMDWKSLPGELRMNVVEAIEEHPPAGQKPVHWVLMTSEPIGTVDQAMRVVDIYRRRWLIEEYFRALKCGCKLEQRQAESAPVLLRVLMLLIPAAWRLLLLRQLGEEEPDASWRSILTPPEFRILKNAVPKAKLDANATAAQCHLAIAKLGGHLPRNGRPGWETLHTGWQRICDFLEGARLSRRDPINA